MEEEIKKREVLLEEMRRIDGIEWMHNKECNSDITIDLFDIRNERWFGWFSRNPQTDEMLLYGQSAKYEGGAKWRIENIETSVLEQIVKPDCTVLVKASRGMAFEEIVEFLKTITKELAE